MPPAKRKPARKRATPAKVGRPSPLVYAPEVGEAIVRSVRGGVPVAIAARAAGQEPSTVRNWISRGASGRAADRAFAAFATAIADARAQAAVDNIVELRLASRGGQVVSETTEVIETVNAQGEVVERRTVTKVTKARPDWRGNAFWLERQIPEDFGRIDRHEVTGKDGGPMLLGIGKALEDPKARKAALDLADRAIASGALDSPAEVVDGEWEPA